MTAVKFPDSPYKSCVYVLKNGTWVWLGFYTEGIDFFDNNKRSNSEEASKEDKA